MNPDVPKELEAICLKAIEKRTPYRYQTAQEMGNDLQNYIFHRNVEAIKFDPKRLFHRFYHIYNYHLKIFFAITVLVFMSIGIWKMVIHLRKREEFKSMERQKQCTKECLFLEKEFQAGSYLKTIGKLEKLTEKNPNYYLPYLLLGKCYYQLDKKKRAKEAFVQAEKLAPENPQLLYESAKFYRMLGKYKQAFSFIGKYIEKIPEAPQGYRCRAKILRFLGKAYSRSKGY